MKDGKLLINVSRLLVATILLSLLAFAPVSAVAAGGELSPGLNALIAQAEALRAGNEKFKLQISYTEDGSDVNKAFPWVFDNECEEIDTALELARDVLTPVEDAINSLEEAIDNFTGKIKSDGSDPYFRLDPGPGKVPKEITAPTNEWTARTPLDNRVPRDFEGTVEMIPYPFEDSDGKDDVLKINYVHDGKTTFGGISFQSPLSPAVNVPQGSTIEFDVYYPKSAQGKYMRWRISTTGSSDDSYLRDYDYNNLNPDWVGGYQGDAWLKTHHSLVATTGNSSNFVLELHGENARPAETGTLIVANIKITAPDPDGIELPRAINGESHNDVAPLKSVYNTDNGLFMVGAIGTGTVSGVRANHYEIFVDGNNLKAEGTHPRGPNWLKSVDGEALSGATTTPGMDEYSIPTGSYQAIRDSGTPGQYKMHGHVLAWYNQAPTWMRQIIPENLPSGYTGTAEFYGLGNGVPENLVKVDNVMAKRVQFNHTMYVMRHFLTTDAKYGSSVSRGVIPFNSWDVLNEEVHESRHSELIPEDPNGWRLSLKQTNWLVAMSDDLIGSDITEHYVYLLFKYAHIAAPNAKMAAAYKANYADLPDYMKLDGHDAEGSIDAYIVDNPPKLTYNDYGIASRTKARTVYNMVRDLNTAWRDDPLYDGRPLIEDVGIQGHDAVGKTLASNNQYAMALYASLIDEGLLSSISYSEFDLKIPTDVPGGGATAPAALNVKQSDSLGYQYALMYKLFTRFAPYVDHIISWGVTGSGWQGSYVLFDGGSNANAGYYGAMNPDKFIQGHSYLDYYFDGEYEKLQDDYEIDLGDLGLYAPKKIEKPYFVEFEDIKVKTEESTPPILPNVVTAIYSDGGSYELAVTWDTIPPNSYAMPGTFVVKGAVDGMQYKAIAKITVTQDVNEPTWPVGSALTVTETEDGIVLAWTEAEDNIEVVSYRIYQNSELIETVTKDELNTNISLLIPGSYTFKVEAGDKADNWSTDGPEETIIFKNSGKEKPFIIVPVGGLKREGGIKATVDVNLQPGADTHFGTEVVVFQLMNGEIPVSIIALEMKIQSDERISAFFNVDPLIESYAVEVFVFNEFNNDTSTSPVILAEKTTIK